MKPSRRKFIKAGALWLPASLAGIGGILRAGSAPSLKVAGTARVNTISRPAAGASYLISEGFEGTGYEYAGWTESGTVDEDYTGTVLKGSQSLRLSGADAFIYEQFTAANEMWAHCRWRVLTKGSSTTNTVFALEAGGLRNCAIWLSHTTNEIYLRTAGSSSAASATALATGTTYYLWLHFVRNATCTLYMSESSTRPSSDGSGNVFLQKTASDVAIDTLLLYNVQDWDVVFDNVLMDDAEIGSNPNP